jgi:DNA-directed RNA polymerase subunit F
MEIIAEEDVDRHKAKKIMEKGSDKKELTYEQKVTLEYLQKLPSLSDEKLKELKEELSKIAILKPRYITLIANILPDTDGEVDALFSKERTNLKKEEIQQIAQIVKKVKG